MGLDTSHGCWHGPYSAFTRWRNAVAEAAGYTVENVTYDSGYTCPTARLDWEAIERENPNCYQGEWNSPAADPLFYLIAHSDCDGVIRPEQGRLLADRLEEVLPLIRNSGLDHHVNKTQQFISGLRVAAERNEDVEFH